MQGNEQIANIVKALAYVENGGKPNFDNPSAGGSGEMKSVFQFMPSTWKMYAKQILGDENTPLNNENELVVVYKKVEKWLNEGKTPKQIASMWNAGEAKADAWDRSKVWDFNGKKIQGWAETNKQGVKFDTPAYADKFERYLNDFSGGKSPQQNVQQQNKPTLPQMAMRNVPPPPVIKPLEQLGEVKPLI